jgi:hypothetical protein
MSKPILQQLTDAERLDILERQAQYDLDTPRIWAPQDNCSPWYAEASELGAWRAARSAAQSSPEPT